MFSLIGLPGFGKWHFLGTQATKYTVVPGEILLFHKTLRKTLFTLWLPEDPVNVASC